MLPIGSLMIEHRLIDRMVTLAETEWHTINETKTVNPLFFDMAFDFFRTYADKFHHGKEEDILFRELARKDLSETHQAMMSELIQEHMYARRTVGSLENAKEEYVKGSTGSLGEVSRILRELLVFYPKHISKEDKEFFFPAMEYLNKEEQVKMVQEFIEYDKEMLHTRYSKQVAEMERTQYRILPKWRCKACDYLYNPEIGDLKSNIKPGIVFEYLLENWVCPICGASKTEFEKIE